MRSAWGLAAIDGHLNDEAHGDEEPEARFGAELRRLRMQAGLSVRQLAEELHRAHSGIVEYEGGRRLPAVRVVEQYEDYFGLPRGTLVAQRERARAQRLERPLDATLEAHLGHVACPYKGLRAFEHEDAALFFGREGQVERVLASLREVRFVAVVGASGSGKSSFARAGLLAGISATASHGDSGARVVVMTPGERPLDELASAISTVAARVSSDDLRADPDALRRATNQAGGAGLVILVDQFEELFTRCREEAQRCRFVDALIAAWRDPTSPVVVIIALRADFYGRMAAYPALAAAVVAHQTLIGSMSPGELLRAIELPAARSGLLLQPGLAQTMLEDLADEPGSLPLLSHALLETWKRRRRLMLTVGGYHDAGGVRGAIAQTAEHNLLSLPEADRAVARGIFLSLTELGEAEPTRRRVDRTELVADPQSAESLERVLGILADARLVTLDERTVVVAHEALIRHWPRLQGWIDADRAGLLIHRRLRDAAREWDTLDRDRAALYRGARIAAASEWAADHADRLSRLEQDFVAASEAAAKRSTHRLRVLAIGLVVVTLIVATLALWALDQRSEARSQVSEVTSLALASSSSALLDSRPDLALLLAFEGYRTSRRVEARSRVLAALTAARDPGVLAILHGHTDAVFTTAFSPDGRLLASASFDATIRLWDARTGKQLGAPIGGHTDYVVDIAFSHDGRTLASASDTTIRLWDVRTRKQIGSPREHADAVGGVAFSPDGTLAYSSGTTIRLWDTRTRKQIGAPLRGRAGTVRDVTFTADGRTLASGGDDRTIRLWDVRTHKQLGTPLKGHAGRVLSVAFSPDGRVLASAGDERSIRLWDARTRKPLGAPLRGHTGVVYEVAFGPSGRVLASAGYDTTVRLWDMSTHKQLGAPLRGHSGVVYGVAFSPRGRTLASAGGDETVRLWDARTPQLPRAAMRGHSKAVMGVAFSPNGSMLASGGDDMTIRLWDVHSRRQLGAPLTGHTGEVSSVAFSPDGRTVASAGADETIRLWDARTRMQLGTPLRGHGNAVMGLAFSPDGRLLASAGLDSKIRLWDARTHAQLGALEGHAGRVFSVAFSPNGRVLASAGIDKTIRLWDVHSRNQLGTPLTVRSSVLYSVAFSPDGRTLAAASGGAIRLWDVHTRKQLGTPLTGHTSDVPSVAFSPNGRVLASASPDGTVRLWDVRSHDQLVVLRGHSGAVFSVAFSPNGRTLASASWDRTVRVWENVLWRSLPELRTEVCDLVGSSGLSTTEWAKHAAAIPYRQSCP